LPPDATHLVFPLPSGAYGAWIAQARCLPVFTLEAVFRIESSVYTGSNNGMTALEGPPPIEGGYAVDAAERARQASAALERLRIIHDRLARDSSRTTGPSAVPRGRV
jgi:hypothetical protein